MTSPSDLELHSAAEAVVAAEQRQAQADAAVAAAQVERGGIAERIAALDAARAEIIARRQRGEKRDDDGGELELNSADKEGLLPLRDERDADLASARAEAGQTAQALAMARSVLQRAEARVEAAALKQHADLLAARLETTLDALQALPPQLRRWGPPDGLLTALTRARFYASVG